ncbi:hypothetical protein [Actinomadura sp.]|uniref:hypothetical protein n=1 Tax=Actinomadura sp. TaxID=1989 RepID=UPI0037C67F4F
MRRRPASDRISRSSAESLLGQITLLGEALERLDHVDSVQRTTTFEEAVTELTAVAREVVAMAHPVLQDEQALASALLTAADARGDIPSDCGACDEVADGLCGDHADVVASAAPYDALGNALIGHGYEQLRTDHQALAYGDHPRTHPAAATAAK